jgi:hypothetical protein
MLTQAVKRQKQQLTGPHSELVVSGAMTILHQYITKMRTSAECCNVWQVRDFMLWEATTHFCMEPPIHTSKIDRHFL